MTRFGETPKIHFDTMYLACSKLKKLLNKLKYNNQLPRIISNCIVIWGIGSGAYLDINYFSYSLPNKFDRSYESLYMLIMFVWAAAIYLNTSYTTCNQTNIESLTNSPDESNGKPILNINNKRFTKFCEQCNAKKFERSSHCSTCNICVLRRDHHCPALGICVGYQNTQGFVNLLIVMLVS